MFIRNQIESFELSWNVAPKVVVEYACRDTCPPRSTSIFRAGGRDCQGCTSVTTAQPYRKTALGANQTTTSTSSSSIKSSRISIGTAIVAIKMSNTEQRPYVPAKKVYSDFPVSPPSPQASRTSANPPHSSSTVTRTIPPSSKHPNPPLLTLIHP